jgi:hypothetical protein
MFDTLALSLASDVLASGLSLALASDAPSFELHQVWKNEES